MVVSLFHTQALRTCAAEAIGAFCLVFAGTGAMMTNQISGGEVTTVGIGLTFGFIVSAMIYATGHLSGAHLNPAVTLAFALARHFSWKRVPLYAAAQITGAIAASAVLRGLLGDVADMGATKPAIGDAQAWGLETLLTFILMFVIMAVATDVRAVGQAAALAIGATVGLEAIFAGPLTGASMNPARSFGPALIGNTWDSHWLYWLGPIMGACLAALAYRWLRGENEASPGAAQATPK